MLIKTKTVGRLNVNVQYTEVHSTVREKNNSFTYLYSLEYMEMDNAGQNRKTARHFTLSF